MSDRIESDDEVKKLEWMVKRSNTEPDPDEPKGMTQFMSSIYVKSKKLAIPALLFLGGTAAVATTAATGGSLPVVLSVCSGSIKLLSVMHKIYKDNRKDTENHPKDKGNNNEQLVGLMGELSENLSKEMTILGTSLKDDLQLVKIGVEKLDRKVVKLINQPNTNIEAAFNEIEKKLHNKCYNSAYNDLENMSLPRMRMASHLPAYKAGLEIRNALADHGKEGAVRVFYYILGLRQKFESLVQMNYFLKDIQENSNSNMEYYIQHEAMCFLSDLEEYWGIMKEVFQDKLKVPTVLIVGKTGTGKSSLCNIMSGLPPDSDERTEGFSTSPETKACTESTTIKECCYFGDPSRPIKLIDTPGFDDPTKNHDATIIADFVKILKEEVKEINLIVFALNGQSPRLEGSLQAMLTIIKQMFTVRVWNNLSVVFTKIPMDTKAVKRRDMIKPDHDFHQAEGFVKTIESEFKPAEGSTQLKYFFIDSHFDRDYEVELTAIHESKEMFWKILNEKGSFDTNFVQNVLTEYATLKNEVEKKNSEIAEKDRIIQQFEKDETNRIAREHDENQKPIEGFTFLQLREFTDKMRFFPCYTDFIKEMCTSEMKPFQSGKSFSETIERINENSNTKIMLCPPQTHLLRSENLVNTIPRPTKKNNVSVSQLIFIMEISNFTKHYLRGDEICVEEGNENILFAWHTGGNEGSLPTTSMLKDFKTFVIPPYAKERLIFRNSKMDIKKTQLKGVLTMRIGKLFGRDSSSKMMLVRFSIEGGLCRTAHTSFSVGFPDMEMGLRLIMKELRKNKERESNSFYHTLIFSRKDKKEELMLGRQLIHPVFPEPGQFNLNCCFGNDKHSRCLVILSQTPEESRR